MTLALVDRNRYIEFEVSRNDFVQIIQWAPVSWPISSHDSPSSKYVYVTLSVIRFNRLRREFFAQKHIKFRYMDGPRKITGIRPLDKLPVER